MPSSHETYDIGQNMGRWNDIYIADSGKLRLGQGDDLQIYHSGSHSYIQDAGTGSLILVANNVTIQNAAQSENIFSATENGSVDLYYDNSKKFETTSDGATVTGKLSIGTTTLGEGSADNLTVADSGHCGITIRSGSSSGGNLFFTDATSDQFQGYVQYDHGNDSLAFGTQKINV